MNFKIVSDSSSDLLHLADVPYATVPLKIVTDEKEYVDDGELNVVEMLGDLERYKGKSGSACPSPHDWKAAFGDGEQIFCVAITSALSGSCNTARIAAEEYTEEFPERRVYVIDTLSAGPENTLIIEKLQQWILEGKEFDEIVKLVAEYQKRTRLAFALESLHNLANNGRVSHVTAKFAGMLGIRAVGMASEQGTLEMTNKSRGLKKALEDILENMRTTGYRGGRVNIHHCQNLGGAENLKKALLQRFPQAEVIIRRTRGLCSFYAERGGLLVGYETALLKKAGATV
ncbi:MAG: DegV family protein [Clostridia bacterium]|nr:DegV family protein [Clostridia bacterium]